MIDGHPAAGEGMVSQTLVDPGSAVEVVEDRRVRGYQRFGLALQRECHSDPLTGPETTVVILDLIIKIDRRGQRIGRGSGPDRFGSPGRATGGVGQAPDGGGAIRGDRLLLAHKDWNLDVHRVEVSDLE